MANISLLPLSRNGLPATETVPLSAIAQDVCTSVATMYTVSGFVPPWIAYLAVRDGEVVGTCAFKTPPVQGRVEIAYFTFPPYEGQGIATAMARALLDLARQAAPHIGVTAQTLPEHNASTSILQKLGFVPAGTVRHPEDGDVWEWRLATPGATSP